MSKGFLKRDAVESTVIPSATVQTFTLWNPLACLSESSKERIALLEVSTVLSTQADVTLFKVLWSKADIKACTSGGASAIYYQRALSRESFLPTLISSSGLLDSSQQNVLEFYREQGVEVIDTPDDSETDLTNCLKIVHEKMKEMDRKISQIFIHMSGGAGGRLDHVLASISTLYKSLRWGCAPVYLMFEQSVTCLLPSGRHLIEVDPALRGDWCSLVPIGSPCDHVTVTGLKYCVDDARLGFGELISTSNSFIESVNQITVTTDGPILWSMGVALSKTPPTLTQPSHSVVPLH